MNYQLVIFDMDGTLVESEHCASQALIDVIPSLTDGVSDVTSRYRGMRLAEILDDIESRYPGSVSSDCVALYREREDILARSMIRPSPGVEMLLSCLDITNCIASNAPRKKTQRSLEICGLADYFDSGIFSAYDVQAWKPDPKLFLHSAASYQVEPSNCVVVEDSEIGIRAAMAAGMTPVLYDPYNIFGPDEAVTKISKLIELIEFLR